MSRQLRLHVPGVIHHVLARGNNKMCIFQDDDDCHSFLNTLSTALRRFETDCAGYCLLWNHYHLLLVPHEHRVSRVMQQLNSKYCQRFNRRHGRVGHVLQGRFGCRIVEEGDYARTVLRYLALNPVASGRAARAEDWSWSSYRAAVGLDTCPDLLALDYVWSAFGTSDPDVGRTRLAHFVSAAIQDDFPNPLLHGSEWLAEQVCAQLEPHRKKVDYVYGHRFAARPTLAALLDGCTDRVSIENAVHAAYYAHAYTLAELGRVLGRHPSTMFRWIQRAVARQPSAAGGVSAGQAATNTSRSDPDLLRARAHGVNFAHTAVFE